MARRRIGQEAFGFVQGERGRNARLDAIGQSVDWAPVAKLLDGIHAAAKGEPGWPPLALFKALLLGLWHDLSDVALASVGELLEANLLVERGDPGADGVRALPQGAGGAAARREAVRRGGAAARDAGAGGEDRDARRCDVDPAGGEDRRRGRLVRLRRQGPDPGEGL